MVLHREKWETGTDPVRVEIPALRTVFVLYSNLEEGFTVTHEQKVPGQTRPMTRAEVVVEFEKRRCAEDARYQKQVRELNREFLGSLFLFGLIFGFIVGVMLGEFIVIYFSHRQSVAFLFGTKIWYSYVMQKPDTKGLRTWIEIDKSAVEHNYKLLRNMLSPKTMFMAVVKSNAYGHSLHDFAREIEKLGADWVGVDSIVEATALRKEGIKIPILVLGYTLPERIEEAADNKITLSVSTFETLEEVSKLKKNLSIHVKVDTGMHRQGFQIGQIPQVIEKLKFLPSNILIDGLFTHFAAAKNPTKQEETLAQIAQFEMWRKAFLDAGLKVVFHAVASAGAMVYPQAHYDMVRFGIAMYGVWPSAEVKGAEKGMELKPILSWRTIIGEVKDVAAGEAVGYDFTAKLTRNSRLAVCPIGYWHGLPRSVSNMNDVLVAGKKARIMGRVSMDMIVIDVTDIPEAKVGSVVTIIGRDGTEELLAYKIADPERTSEYEIITRLNPLIKRFFV